MVILTSSRARRPEAVVVVEAVVVAAVVKIAVAMVIAATNPRPIATTVQPHEEETVELRVQQVGAQNTLIILALFVVRSRPASSLGQDQPPVSNCGKPHRTYAQCLHDRAGPTFVQSCPDLQ